MPCSVVASQVIAEEAALFKITVSFGSVTSLISLPCYMSHASIPAEVRAARGLPDDLVRISVGIEDVHDLLAGESPGMFGGVLLCNGCLLEPEPSSRAELSLLGTGQTPILLCYGLSNSFAKQLLSGCLAVMPPLCLPCACVF